MQFCLLPERSPSPASGVSPGLWRGWSCSPRVHWRAPLQEGGWHGHLPRTVMASPSSPQPSSCSMLASRMAKATWRITLMPS